VQETLQTLKITSACFTFDQPDKVKPVVFSLYKKTGQQLEVQLPPHAVVQLSLK
jgi:hypothetical protein